MPPFIALSLSAAFILFVLARERRMNPDVSAALWIPLLWLFFIGTRFPSVWMNAGEMSSGAEYLEGSPLDQAVFLALYLAAAVVLIRRQVSAGTVAAASVWVSLFLLYGLISVTWSDYPWTALKRFFKVLEHVLMVLVVLTEPNPAKAMDALLRRFLTVALVLSVTFLKYFPELSRGFSEWTGEAINTGVTTDKNALGHICVIGAVFYASSLLYRPHRDLRLPLRGRTVSDVIMVGAIVWLLSIADAMTALVCALVGAASVVVLARTQLRRNPRLLMTAIVGCVLLVAGLESTIGLRDQALEALNRDPTLTDRTFVWADVLAMPNNVLLGTGFESFWLGWRLDVLWDRYWWRPNQAHNGYIETFINLGAIGLALMLAMMFAALLKALAWLSLDDPFGPVRFGLLLAIAILNYTDATFKAVHILFFTFFLVAISLTPVRAVNPARSPPLGTAAETAGSRT